jgi:valyl-tRNA synthetase
LNLSFFSAILSHMELPELSKTYTAAEWEDRLYQAWLESGYFSPDVCLEKGVADITAEPFSMVLPPPNATGTLHTGSAAMLAIEDTFTRFARMQGRPTLWLPGTDHAAIATQSKVERILWEEEKLTRYDLGREELLRRIGVFVENNRDTMKNQMRKMGSSLDWSREAFTLDEKRHQAVYKAFKTMYDDGIIFRGDRIVNWDPKGQTTISDDEVVYKEEVSQFYYLQYGPFEIATARPETKFGDKYVVMHPDDARYATYTHGQTIDLEWINGPITATIIKDESIDMEFGTGVMTITPWHSMVDFEIAERHGLDKEQIIDLEGKLLSIAGEFAGKHIKEARAQIIAKLQSKGLVTKIEENYVHQVATAERTGEIIEPQIMRQWFVGVDREFTRDGQKTTLKKLMQQAITSRGGDISILPERFEKTYFHWIDNLRDWCISRQIWYGHQIPVWYRGEEVFCGTIAPEGDDWTQDPDTLDTWFSSALWSFSTLGWGYDEALFAEQKKYHPTTLIESGYDILFFWMSRMILMSTYLLGKAPFKTIYLHGLVRDEEGRKMSKSLDNILDPLDVIKDYGTDALRLALVSGTTPGNDMRLGDEKLTSSRNFVNKLWNISRYVIGLTKDSLEIGHLTPETKTISDRWILGQLEETIQKTTEHLNNYQLSLAQETLRDFTLNDFADWYIEIHKVEKNDTLLLFILRELLKLWHPFMPFVTEAIWSHLDTPDLLLVTRWPQSTGEISPVQSEFEQLQTLITRIRNIRATYRIAPKAPLEGTLYTATPALFESNRLLIEKMASLVFTTSQEETTQTPGSISIIEGGFTVSLQLASHVDFQAEENRLIKELSETERFLSGLSARLDNPKFRDNAPASVIEAQEKTRQEMQEKIIALNTALEEVKIALA